ncbi:MAG: penicillin-binding protein activator [Pseudomonadota bacterium]
MTQRSLIRTRLSVLALLLALVAGCTSLPGGTVSESRAQRLLDAGEPERAATVYLELAGLAEGGERDRLLVRAARAFTAAGDASRAGVAINRVAEPRAADRVTDWLVARAALANLQDNGVESLALLDEVDMRGVTLNQRIDLEGERGTALFLTGQPLEAVSTLNRRELWLGTSEEIKANHTRIWDGLLRADPARLRDAVTRAGDRVVAGWIALGLIFDGSGEAGPRAGVAGWTRQYPGHPAIDTIIREWGEPVEPTQFEPRQVALLATLSGRAAPIGEAVRDGFLGHYAAAQQGRVDAPIVRVYDIAEMGATLAWQQAVADGAELIVGPILPAAVEELAMNSELTVPTLTLNYLREPTGQPLLFQFGLAPEDEAAAAALRAIGDGHRRAVAFVPASNWGERVLQAFADTFSAYGGVVVDHATYIAEDTDYSSEIQSAMLLDDSVTRYRRMRSLVGQPLQFEPRRRADVDFIFMAAASASAERLRPQFRFHYSGDLPVYATSAVNAPGRDVRARDLEGVRFTEIPWLTADMRGKQTPLTVASAALASARRQPRLFALGYDAYGAVSQVAAALGGALPPQRWQGATGGLELRATGDIRRSTEWAVFRRGQTVALPALDPRVDPMAPAALDDPDAPFGDDPEDAFGSGGDEPRQPTIITLD